MLSGITKKSMLPLLLIEGDKQDLAVVSRPGYSVVYKSKKQITLWKIRNILCTQYSRWQNSCGYLCTLFERIWKESQWSQQSLKPKFLWNLFYFISQFLSLCAVIWRDYLYLTYQFMVSVLSMQKERFMVRVTLPK